MKLTIQLQLLPTPSQAELLLATMTRFNEAASFAAEQGFTAGVFSQPSVHKLAYQEIRERFGLGAQLAVRAIGKAVECFSRDKTICPVFLPLGAVTYDQRNLAFKGLDKVSLATLSGREVIGMVYGEYQRERFDRIKGQCDLVYRGGKFYLLTSVDLPEASPMPVKDFIGVDLGIVNILATHDEEPQTGKKIDRTRKRAARARTTYQRRNSRSARARLRKLSRRQSRFQKDTNHCLSKKLVAKALREGKGIGLEDLTGIRTRTEATVRHTQRARHSNWSFSHLRLCIEYKAKLVGVPVVQIDPRNTSRTCSVCGHCEKANRKSQSEFLCKKCGHTDHAETNGAKNIRSAALAAYVNSRDLVAVAIHNRPSYKPPTSVVGVDTLPSPSP
jgi:IS605 OrfB family transposase